MEERFLRFDYRQFNQANLLRILGRLGDPWRLRLLYISTYRANCTRTESLLSLFSRADLHVKTLLLGHSRLRHIRVVRDLI